MKQKCAEECPEDGEEIKMMKDVVDISDEVTGTLHVEDDNAEKTTEDKRRRKEWRATMKSTGPLLNHSSHFYAHDLWIFSFPLL